LSLIVSNEIIEEYEEKLAWFYSEYFAEIVLEEILNLPQTEQNEAYFKWQLITEDPDDNKYVDIAVASNADYIISNDRHFRVLQKLLFPKIEVVTLDEFKVIIEKK
jgi:uncharacterized protein